MNQDIGTHAIRPPHRGVRAVAVGVVAGMLLLSSAIARDPLHQSFDEESALLFIKSSGEPDHGSLALESSGGRTFVRGRLITASDDVSSAWLAKIALHHPNVPGSDPFGQSFSVTLDLGRPEGGETGVPMTVWGLLEDGKSVKLLSIAFVDAENLEVNASLKTEIPVSGAAFKESGFVRLRLVFDAVAGTFSLFVGDDSEPAVRESAFLADALPKEIYQITWGGKGAQPGNFAVDDFTAEEL